MRISSLISPIIYKSEILNCPRTATACSLNSPVKNDSFEKQPVKKVSYNSISFLGHPVHLIDGGVHAENMSHFARAISSDMDIFMHEVETNVHTHNLEKQMKGVYESLSELAQRVPGENEYIAMPATYNVSLLSLEANYNAVMSENITLLPKNLAENKPKILNFLKKLEDNPTRYQDQINLLDPLQQGITYVPKVIEKISECIKKGYKVYIPTGHPDFQSIKWLTSQTGNKPELYHYISTGEDSRNVIHNIREDIKEKRWHQFNLINLSEATKVNIRSMHGDKPHLYAAYASCVDDAVFERGSYNFCPVRVGGEIKGFSYTDESTIQYPYDEFHELGEIQNIVNFVGKPISEVLATEEETGLFMQLRNSGYVPEGFAFDNKLYKISDVFSPEERQNNKLDMMGKFTDSSCKSFFDTNDKGFVVFPKVNCDGSNRPSVMAMWGTCFSMFNAIERDIRSNNDNIF